MAQDANSLHHFSVVLLPKQAVDPPVLMQVINPSMVQEFAFILSQFHEAALVCLGPSEWPSLHLSILTVDQCQ